MINNMKLKMLPKEKLEKGYALLDINTKGNTTKSITFHQEDILLSYIEGMTLEEIAEEIGIQASGVREHLLRINNKIKHLLGEGDGLIYVITQPDDTKNAQTEYERLLLEKARVMDELIQLKHKQLKMLEEICAMLKTI